MKFREMKLALFRKELERRKFYEEVTFEDKLVSKNSKKIIGQWIFNLENYKKIKINKFKELFSQLNEIVFPIKIQYCYSSNSLDIMIIDNKNNQYYMSNLWIYSYNDLEKYTIGRRNSPLEPLIDREFTYRILKNKNILLLEMGVLKLNPDGTNDNISVEFKYNFQKQITEVTLSSYISNHIIKIEYPTMDEEFDRKVLELLLNINDKNYYYYDAFPILKLMLSIISDETISLCITAKVEDEISSDIYIEKGIVQRYTKTEIISENQMNINKTICAKNLEEFLAERT